MKYIRVLISLTIFANYFLLTYQSVNKTTETENVVMNLTTKDPMVKNISGDFNVTAVEFNQTESSSIKPSTDDETIMESVQPCGCDLTVELCDANCCCDHDCTTLDRQVFTDCVDLRSTSIVSHDPRYCFKENFIVRNNTPYKMIYTSDDLFCIYRDNYQQRFQYKDQTTVTSEEEFRTLMKKHSRFSWYIATEVKRHLLDGMNYKSGSPIFIKYTNGNNGYLALPGGFPTGLCNGNHPMYFLKPRTSTCHQHLTNLRDDCSNNEWLSGFKYFDDFQVAQTRTSIKDEMNSTGTNFLPITPYLCTSIVNGIIVEPCDSKVEIPEPKYNTTDRKCHDAVSTVVYVIQHNGTQGLSSVEVYLTLGVIDESSTSWSQYFGVKFKWVSVENKTKEELTFIRSGNPGYIKGAPIIAGKLITSSQPDNNNGDSDEKGQQVAVQMYPDQSTWLTVMGASESGFCIWETVSVASSDRRIPIRFGYNMKSGCHLVVSLDNITDVCRFIESVAIDALQGLQPLDVVAAFGNPTVDNPDEWVPILRENRPSNVHRSSNTNAEMACTNIVSRLDIEIIFAKMGHIDNPQIKIIGVLFKYGLGETLQLHCGRRFCHPGSENLSQSFQVITSVSFLDASEPAVPMYAVPPTIHVQLPYDFFYPFHGTSAAASSGSHGATSVIISIFYFYILFSN